MGALMTSPRPGNGGSSGMMIRVACSVAAVLLYGLIDVLLNPAATLVTAQMAGKQFDNSDMSYAVSSVGMRVFGHLGVPFVVLLGLLLAIWWRPLRGLIGALALAGGVLAATHPAAAYYDKADYTEAYTILPDESAFWIPTSAPTRTIRHRSSRRPI